MTIGQEHVLLPGNIAHHAFDYVALGHIHKHQVVPAGVPVVYSGSLERIDFGEEDDEKGFYVVEIGPAGGPTRRAVSYRFQPVVGRRFLTLDINVEPSDVDPMGAILNHIAARREKIRDAIVRVVISLPADGAGRLRDSELRDALKEAHSFTISRDVRREVRLRMGNVFAESLAPLEALKAYLGSSKVPGDRARVLLEYGQRLIEEQSGGSTS